MDVKYERFCFPVTLSCNLNCKLCAEHSPYRATPYNPTQKELRKQLDALFQLVKYIDKFDITGGEPFLRTDLSEIIAYIYYKYRTKIGTLRVTTNGTRLPPDGFIESATLWSSNMFVIVDNYSVSDKGEKVWEILKKAKIFCELRSYTTDLHCDGWVDYGNLSPKHSRADAKVLFKKCMVPKLGFFSCIVNGRIFPCAKSRLLYEHGILDVSVDIFDDALHENGKKARMNDLLGDEVIEACKYCNGLCEDGIRYTPAEQLSMDKKEVQRSIEYESWQLKYGKVLFYTQTYNNENTIGRTIESVLNQTKDDYTYFIVNNGSTDSTGEMIRHYMNKDKHIVYVQCEKNDMLAVNFMPYILFSYIPEYLNNYFCIVDGDDSIEPNFLEKVLNIISKKEIDLIVPAANRIIAETGAVIDQRRPIEDILVSGRKKADEFYNLRPLLLCQWGKVHKWNKYKKMKNIFLDKYFFQIPKWFHQADTTGVLSAFYLAEEVVFVSEPIYNYFLYTQSTYSSYLPRRIENDVLMFRIYNDFLKRFGDVSKFNRDYCFAIYLSLLYENLSSLFHTEAICDEQKLSDLLNILSAKETKLLLTGKFDKEFYNLNHREDFLNTITEYLQTLTFDLCHSDFVDSIYTKLKEYRNYSQEERKE